jgi:hypothetical protein
MHFLIWRPSSGSAYMHSPGSVYPTLTLLEELAICARPPPRARSAWSRSPTRVAAMWRTIGPARTAHVVMAMAAHAASSEMPPEDVHRAMHAQKAALSFHRTRCDADETERVRKIFDKAAAGISKRFWP